MDIYTTPTLTAHHTTLTAHHHLLLPPDHSRYLLFQNPHGRPECHSNVRLPDGRVVATPALACGPLCKRSLNDREQVVVRTQVALVSPVDRLSAQPVPRIQACQEMLVVVLDRGVHPVPR